MSDETEDAVVRRKNDELRARGVPPCAEAAHDWRPWIGSERCTRCTYHRNRPAGTVVVASGTLSVAVEGGPPASADRWSATCLICGRLCRVERGQLSREGHAPGCVGALSGAIQIETLNRYGVGVRGDRVVLRPGLLPASYELTAAQAKNLAAWLAVSAETVETDEGAPSFEDVLRAVENA